MSNNFENNKATETEKQKKNEALTKNKDLQSPIQERSINSESKESTIFFDNALALAKFGKFNYFLIFISGTILTTVLLETLGISFILPVAECDMDLTTRNKGFLSAIGFAGIITSSPLWGFLADTIGRRKIILPTLLLAFTLTVISSLTQHFWTFLVLRYFNGFFVSGPSATIYAYLGEFHTHRHRSRAIMYASVIFGVTCILLPLMAWLVINQNWELYIPIIDLMFKPWRLFIIICGLPSFICAIALIKIPESPKFDLYKGEEVKTIETLQFINRFNNGWKVAPLKLGKIIEDDEFTSLENDENRTENRSKIGRILVLLKGQTIPLFTPPYLKKTLIACMIQFGIFTSSNGMYMFFPLILNHMADFMSKNPTASASICEVMSSRNHTEQNSTRQCSRQLDISTYEHSLVLEILYAIGFAFIGVIINAVGKFPILFCILIGCGSCGILTVLIDVPIVSIYLYVVLLLCGLAVTVVNAATIDLFPTNFRAMAVCISLMMGRLGSVAGANTLGFLLDNYCELSFLLSGSILIFCGILAFFIPNIRKKMNKPEPSLNHRDSISSLSR